MITSEYPFDIHLNIGTAGERHWIGLITWERDLATQIVSIRVVADKVGGPSNSGFYVYWNPARAVEFRPEGEVYPTQGNVSFAIQEDGMGYLYLSGTGGITHIDETYRYVTGAPIVDEELPPTGSMLGDINARIEPVGVAVYPGYAPTGAKLPYIVTRPLDVGLDDELALNGDAFDWGVQVSAYCCAASVEASFNLALTVMGTLQGARVRDTTLSTTMGYNGAEVEGHYESQVTIQLDQGVLS